MLTFLRFFSFYSLIFFGTSKPMSAEKTNVFQTISSTLRQKNSGQFFSSASHSNENHTKSTFLIRGGLNDEKLRDEFLNKNEISDSPVTTCIKEPQNVPECRLGAGFTTSFTDNNLPNRVALKVKSIKNFRKISSDTNSMNLTERVGSAVSMLLLFYLITERLGEKGINALVLIVEVVTYSEVTKMVDPRKEYSLSASVASLFEKWWWFLTVLSCISMTTCSGLAVMKLEFVPYVMIVTSLVVAVIRMSLFDNAIAADYRTYLGKFVVYHFTLIFLLGHSCFWNRTVQRFGIEWLIYPCLLVIVNDTMAYFFGKSFGNHHFLPKLSPNKTAEGFIGAAFSTYLISFPLLKLILGRSAKTSKALSVIGTNRLTYLSSLKKHARLMATYVSLLSPFGGFLASAIKRAYNSKDFGSSIAGHGGFVDRLDCQLITAPFVYFYLSHSIKNIK